MNFRLFLDLLYSTNRSSKFPSLRTDLSFPQILSRNSVEDLKNNCLSFVKAQKEFKLVKFLQVNVARSRVVALLRRSDSQLVILKWIDVSLTKSFNFLNYIDSEIRFHERFPTESISIVPRLVKYGKNFIIVEYVEGVTLLELSVMDGRKLNEYPSAIIDALSALYHVNDQRFLEPDLLNSELSSSIKQRCATRGSTLSHSVSAAFSFRKDSYNLFCAHSEKIFAIYDKIPARSLSACVILGDLHEANILINTKSNKITFVDLEDTRISHPIFDLADLSCRLIVLGIPNDLDTDCLQYVKAFLKEYEPIFHEETFKIFKSILAINLIITAANPWLWPSENSFTPTTLTLSERARLLRRIWSAIEKLSQ